MRNNLKRFTSLVLSLIMSISCFLIVNTTSVSAYTPETLYKFYVSDADATANGDDIANNATSVFTNANRYGSSMGSTVNFDILNHNYQLSYIRRITSTLSITVPAGSVGASLYMVGQNYSSGNTQMALTKDGVTYGESQTLNSTALSQICFTGLGEGTYTLKPTSNGYFNFSLLILAVPKNNEVSGKVTDNKGNPIKCATVNVNGTITRTNESGEYSVNALDGENSFKVTALGYSSHTENISVNEDITKDVVIHRKVDKIYKFYGGNYDAANNYDSISDNASNVFTDLRSDTSSSYTATTLNIGGSTYNFSYMGYRNTNRYYTIVVPEGVETADLYLTYRSAESYNNADLTLSKNGTTLDSTKTISPKTVSVVNYSGLSAGTYTVSTDSYSLYPVLFVLATSPIYTISGTVTDEMGEPIKCATVYVGDNLKLITDGDGNYSTDVAEGTVINNISATALGYEDYDKTVSITDETVHNITLKKKSVTYKFFGNTTDASNNYDSLANNDTDVFPRASTGAIIFPAGTYNICGSSYNLSLASGGYGFDIVVPSGMENVDFYMVAVSDGYGDRQLTLTKDDATIDEQQSLDKEETPTIVKYSGLSEGKYTLASDGYFCYSFMALVSSDLPITETNITDCVTAIDNGLVSEVSSSSPFADIVANLDETDKIFTLVGMVNGDYTDNDFMNQVDKVGFAFYDADVVDSLGEDAKIMNPILLKKKYSSTDFGEETVMTDEVYKNFYDANQYDESLDSELEYTGATSLEEGSDKSYFAYVIALGKGKRYYVYPYTLYNGESQNVFDGTSEDKIEIANN